MIKNQLVKIKIFLFPCLENNYRPSVLSGRFLSYLALGLVLLKLVGVFYLAFLPGTYFFADINKGALIQMANGERAIEGLPPLTENSILNHVAYLKAQDMVKNDYFAHWSPAGLSPWHWFNEAGYNFSYAGENLAMGFLDAKNIHREWLASPTHRDNIVEENYSDIGIAVVEKDFYGKRTFLVVQVFGTKKHNIVPEVVTRGDITLTENENPLAVPETVNKEILPKESITEEGSIPEEELPIDDYTQEIEELSLEETGEVTIGNITFDDREMVLGDQNIYLYPSTIGEGGIKSSLFKFLMLDYDDLLKKITFFAVFFIGFSLAVNIFVRFDIQHPDLMFRGFGFLILFVIFTLFDQATLVRIIVGTPLIG